MNPQGQMWNFLNAAHASSQVSTNSSQPPLPRLLLNMLGPALLLRLTDIRITHYTRPRRFGDVALIPGRARDTGLFPIRGTAFMVVVWCDADFGAFVVG